MASDGVNTITKWAIVIIAAIIAVWSGITLFRRFTDEDDFTSDKIIDIIFRILAFALAALACYGAFTENASLCYIALVFAIIFLIYAIWALVKCFIKDDIKCETTEYILTSVYIILYILIVVCIFSFIQSIK